LRWIFCWPIRRRTPNVKSGNNFQQSRPDLPLYLPGNGGLLWALAVVCQNDAFRKDGNWDVRWEGLSDTGFQALLASAQ
jgi:hypothetical protein